MTAITTKIIADFEKRNNVLTQINDNRERMININFIMIVNDMQRFGFLNRT